MKIINRVDNENGFSWWTIEKDDNSDTFYLFVNNKKGVHRELTHSGNIELINICLDRHIQFSKKMNVTMKGVIEKLTNAPEALERLQKKQQKEI
jgi:hypothetical protein